MSDCGDEVSRFELTQDESAGVRMLAESVLDSHLTEMKSVKASLVELTRNQEVIVESLEHENAKFTAASDFSKIAEIMTKSKEYRNKLINIKKEMVRIHDRTQRLKKRACKLQEYKQRSLQEKTAEVNKAKEREEDLIAKIAS